MAYDDETEVLDVLELQADIEESVYAIAFAAVVHGPAVCGRTASDLSFAVEEAFRLMGANTAARPKLAAAMAEHLQKLRAIAKKWADDE